MPITHPGGTIVYRDFAGDTRHLIASGIRDAAVDAGWSSVGVAARVFLTFTGNPSDGQTVTIGGVVFTAKNSPAGVNDFAINAGDFTITAANLAAKIAANHATCTATADSGIVTVTARTAGTSGNEIAVSEGLSNASFSNGGLVFGGYKITCPEDPGGNRMTMHLYTQSGAPGFCVLNAQSADGQVTAPSQQRIEEAASRLYRVIANQFTVCVFLPTATGFRQSVLFGIVRVYDRNRALRIVNVTDSGGEFMIQTDAPHFFQSLMSVYIANSGVSSLNGQHVSITVVDDTKFTIDGSVYQAGWTAGGLVAEPGKIANCFFSVDGGENSAQSWRRNPTHWSSLPSIDSQSYTVNLLSYAHNNNSGSNGARLLVIRDAPAGGTPVKFGEVFDAIGAEIGWNFQSQFSAVRFYGFLYGLMLYQAGLDRDTEQTLFQDGHDWVVIGSSGGHSLLMAIN